MERRLKSIWDQTEIPVILRRTANGAKIRLRLPYSKTNRQWLQNGHPPLMDWIPAGAFWEIPKAWFNDFVNRALVKYGKLYIIQPYRETEVCARACMEAKGHECQCSCMGANHGAGMGNKWFEVSETFAVRSTQRVLACRLLIAGRRLDEHRACMRANDRR